MIKEKKRVPNDIKNNFDVHLSHTLFLVFFVRFNDVIMYGQKTIIKHTDPVEAVFSMFV